MNSRTVAIIIIVAVFFAAGAFFLLTGQGSRSIIPSGGPNALAGVEVRSYEGKDLSSIGDFRENSIKGPQYVNITDYRLTLTGLTNKTSVYTYNDILDKYPHY